LYDCHFDYRYHKILFEKNPDLSSPFAAACATTTAAVAGVFFNQIFFFLLQRFKSCCCYMFFNSSCSRSSSFFLLQRFKSYCLVFSSHFQLLLLLLIAYLPMLLFCNILGKHKKSAIALRGAGSDFCTYVCVFPETQNIFAENYK